ncbi:hypothetical protein CGCSCA5_v005250 [Colletotrichum siamense]|nr:hypothetical protein CGCSCA5_v005250 [Colletotrichum siamense]
MHLLYKALTSASIPPLPLPPRDYADSAEDVDTHSIGGVIVASVVPATAISTMFALSRLFVRGWIQKKVHFDDGILLAAVISGWTSTATTLKAVAIGHGRHVASLSDHQKEEILHWTVMAFSFGIFALILPKIAVVALMNRLLQPKRGQRLFLWALVAFCSLGLLGNVLGLYTQCSPSQAEMSFMTKACLGPDMAVEYSISTSDDSADLVIWTSLEADVVIIAVCIPAMQPLIDHLLPHPSDASTLSSHAPTSPTSFTPRKKLWSISHDPEAARDWDTEIQIPEMIMVEREFEINVTRSVHTWTPDTNPSAVTDDEKFRIVKDQGPDGTVTTTVVVMSSAPADVTRFPQA